MQGKVNALFAVAVLICLIPASALAALVEYSTDFETYSLPVPDGLLGDGWLVYGSVFPPDGEPPAIYGYGTFAAPNNSLVDGFCDIVTGQGGVEQGDLQLAVYSDYNNGDHAAGNIIESNVFQEQTIGAEDVGDTWTWTFDAKLDNLVAPSTAAAFIKTIDPGANYDMTNFLPVDMTSIPTTWSNYSVSITIDAGLVGQLLQFGFINRATNYNSSGIIYDNVLFFLDDVTDVPTTRAAGAVLGQNYPNPFNPSTRIDFTLQRAGGAEITVVDLAGRRVATLRRGALEAGDHHVVWDGRGDDGTPAPAGMYRYVLKTDAGQLSRSMVLVK